MSSYEKRSVKELRALAASEKKKGRSYCKTKKELISLLRNDKPCEKRSKKRSIKKKSPVKKKSCKIVQIRNPKTGRCVLRSGNIGKSILSKSPSKRSASKRRSSKRRSASRKRSSKRRSASRKRSIKKKSPVKKKSCKIVQIRNPKTGRCVLRSGNIEKIILSKSPSKRSASRKRSTSRKRSVSKKTYNIKGKEKTISQLSKNDMIFVLSGMINGDYKILVDDPEEIINSLKKIFKNTLIEFEKQYGTNFYIDVIEGQSNNIGPRHFIMLNAILPGLYFDESGNPYIYKFLLNRFYNNKNKIYDLNEAAFRDGDTSILGTISGYLGKDEVKMMIKAGNLTELDIKNLAEFDNY